MPEKAVITVGADPELFVLNYQNYVIESLADHKVPGTKEKPAPMKGLGKGFTFHRDNVMLEYGVPPALTADDFARNNVSARNWLQGWVQENIGGDHGLYDITTVEITAEQMTNPLAREFGCEPDYDAYEGGTIRRAPDDIMGRMRTGGGHIHVGTSTGFNCPEFIVAMLLDATIGVTYPFNDRVDASPWYWYRKPGIYRPKDYGLEYRSPSNRWTTTAAAARKASEHAFLVGQYCSTATAKQIRSLIESVDWLGVRAQVGGVVNKKSSAIPTRNRIIAMMREVV